MCLINVADYLEYEFEYVSFNYEQLMIVEPEFNKYKNYLWATL